MARVGGGDHCPVEPHRRRRPVGVGHPRRARRHPVPDGARPGGDERLDQSAGGGLRHDGHVDPGGDHALLAHHGRADAHRGEDRRHHRSASGVLDRPGHLLHRLGPHRRLLVGAVAHARLVDPRGHRGRPGVAGVGCPDRRQLRRPVAGGGLRGDRRHRRCRHRGRTHPRRLGHHRAHLAHHLRRGGGRRHRDLPRLATRERCAQPRPETAPRRGGQPLVGGRDGPVRAGHPPGEQLGMAAAQELPDRAIRVQPHALCGRSRAGHTGGVPLVAGPARTPRPGPAGALRVVRHRHVALGPVVVLRPEPDPDGHLLRGAALPATGAGARRPRHRYQDAAGLDHDVHHLGGRLAPGHAIRGRARWCARASS